MKSSPTPRSRKLTAKACCQTIVLLMGATERTRMRDSAAVLIGADLWKRIYLNARKGAK